MRSAPKPSTVLREDTPWCSVIIPTLNEAASLPATLAALRRNWPAEGGYEIIVVDGGSDDGTPALAAARGVRVLRSAPGRARQLNAGAAVARGRYFYFLHGDTCVPPSLSRHLRAAARQNLPAACRIRFVPEDNGWVRLFGWLSRFNVSAFRYGDQSLFVSATTFRAVGGYDERHLIGEGNDLARRLRRHAGGFIVLPATVNSSARRYRAFGPVYTQTMYVLIYFLLRLGLSQRRLRAVYDWAFGGATKVGTARKLPSAAHSSQR